MKIEFDLHENEAFWNTVLGLVIVALVIGLGWIGSGVTEAASPRALSWTDWQMLKARELYQTEIVVLREDASQLAMLLDSPSDRISAHAQTITILRHTQSVQSDTLYAASAALADAANKTYNWISGIETRDNATLSLALAVELLR
jgi:hypothetical protein